MDTVTSRNELLSRDYGLVKRDSTTEDFIAPFSPSNILSTKTNLGNLSSSCQVDSPTMFDESIGPGNIAFGKYLTVPGTPGGFGRVGKVEKKRERERTIDDLRDEVDMLRELCRTHGIPVDTVGDGGGVMM